MNATKQSKRHNTARPSTGRASQSWSTAFAEDQSPMGFKGGLANLTEYVGDDPTNETDPIGLDSVPMSEAKGGNGEGASTTKGGNGVGVSTGKGGLGPIPQLSILPDSKGIQVAADGAIVWPITWQLDRKAGPKGGFVVQKLTVGFTVNGEPQPQSGRIWYEAFPVDPGATTVTYPKLEKAEIKGPHIFHGIDLEYLWDSKKKRNGKTETWLVDDFYSWVPPASGTAVLKVTGEAAYWDNFPLEGGKQARWTNSMTPGVYYPFDTDARQADPKGKIERIVPDVATGLNALGFSERQGLLDLGSHGHFLQVGALELAEKKLAFPDRRSKTVAHNLEVVWKDGKIQGMPKHTP